MEKALFSRGIQIVATVLLLPLSGKRSISSSLLDVLRNLSPPSSSHSSVAWALASPSPTSSSTDGGGFGPTMPPTEPTWTAPEVVGKGEKSSVSWVFLLLPPDSRRGSFPTLPALRPPPLFPSPYSQLGWFWYPACFSFSHWRIQPMVLLRTTLPSLPHSFVEAAAAATHEKSKCESIPLGQ